MPLIKEKELSKGASWFSSECSRDRAHHTEDNQWNSRHLALFANDWIGKKPDHQDWGMAEVTSIDFSCGRLIIGEHSKSYSGFGEIIFPQYYEASYATVALKARAEELRYEFEVLSKRWQRDSRHISLISKKVAHPAYLRIIGMGEAAIPLLLEALRDKPDHWFAALRAIANTDPCPIDANPSEAREAWLSWGKSHGYID